MKFLHEAAGPADGCSHRSLSFPKAEKDIFAMLRKKTRAGLNHHCLPTRTALNRNGGADRIAVALHSLKMKRNRWRQFLYYVFQQPQLRSIAILQEHFKPAIVIEVGEGKRSSILHEVHADRGGDIGERSISIIGVKNIPFVAAPCSVGTNQLVDRIPALLVLVRRASVVGGTRHNLPPEKTIEILARGARNHAIHNINTKATVMIEIERVPPPPPPAHPAARRFRGVVEGRSTIPEQR